MAKSLSLVLFHKSLLPLRPNLILTFSLLPKPHTTTTLFPLSSSPPSFFSTTSTPYPLQYDLIINRPTKSSLAGPRRRLAPDESAPESSETTPKDVELGFDDWVDRKLSKANRPRSPITDLDDSKAKFQFTESAPRESPGSDSAESSLNNVDLDYQDQPRSSKDGLDKSKRKYYNKRMKRMYGSDSDDELRKKYEDGYVELQPEVVEFHRLHKREEELYFYDTFAYPWEKDKHYKMVYQLEKKYFPDHCLDKAFLEPGVSGSVNASDGNARDEKRRRRKKEKSGEDDKRLVFFEEEKEVVKKDVMEKKVEDFFKTLKKVQKKKGNDNSNVSAMSDEEGEPYVLKRNSELPPRWDGPYGTMVLINKPKGWTSFTVCGKLRRLVKVKKVGHAGTLDPMATGLLIVCVGKATKLVDRYQGMIKGYSGVFRLGEATSTWDADSPVIQREPWEHIKDTDIKKASASFLGEIWQVPPMFSAIKVGGEKMYEKARRGESIELAPRRISIFKFEIERSLEDRQNLIFRVTCSKGTYIRSLCADFGKALGSCAHLIALRRDSIGEYSADDAWDFKDLEDAITKGYL